MPGSEALHDAIRSRVFPLTPRSDAAIAVASLVARGGGSVAAVVFFGSRKTDAGPDPWSAYDFFVLTREYQSFYRALRAAGSLRRSPWLVALLNAILPPNQISVAAQRPDGSAVRAKCAVITLDTLVRETSRRRRDHFCSGRLFQPTEVLFSADAPTADRVLAALASAHALSFEWVRPWLPACFDVESYCRTLLRVSLGGEIRPEPEGRADRLWEAQRDYLSATYGVLLRDLAEAGKLTERGAGVYALTTPVAALERLRTRLYFLRSLVRATARWAKYMVSFEDWLEYIVRKAQRHTGKPILLSPSERRWPVIFLWPRLIRYLRDKDGRT